MCVFPTFTLIVSLGFSTDQTFGNDSFEIISLFFSECRHQVYRFLFAVRSGDSWGGHSLFELRFLIHLVFVLLADFTPELGIDPLLKDLDGHFFGDTKMVLSLASDDPVLVIAAFLNLSKVEIV